MGIDISNTTFKKFTDFAATVSGRTRLAVDNLIGNDGEVRNIKASTNWDFIGNVGRGATKREANEQVRTFFLNAVAELFGGVAHIPANVKDAMEMQNFGRGKPLTARRIIAVQRAIEDVKTPTSYLNYSGTVEAAVAELRQNANPRNNANEAFPADEVRQRVDVLISAVGGDLDLLNVLKDELLVNKLLAGRQALRSEDEIKAKVAEIKASVEELRQAAGGDKSLFYMGLRGIVGMRGKTLSAGMIASIVDQVMTADISGLRKISGASGVMQLHKGILQYETQVGEIMRNSNALSSLKGEYGADDIANIQRFIGRLLISRCSQSNQSAILDAIRGDACAQLQSVYGDISFAEAPEGMDKDLWEEATATARTGMDEIFDIAHMIVPDGTQPEVAHPIQGDDRISEDSKTYKKILADIVGNAEVSLKAKVQATVNEYVSGNGQGADIVRDAFAKKVKGLIKNKNAGATIKDEMGSIALNSLHYNIMTNAKSFATAAKLEDTLFARDLDRFGSKGSVTLAGRKLSINVNEAADQIAEFVTGGAKKFAELDGKERMKAFVMMAMITQNTMQTLSRNIPIALDPNKNQMPFSLNDDGADPEQKSFTVIDFTMDENGGLTVDAKFVNHIHSIHEGKVANPSAEDMQRPTDGRTITAGVKLELPKTAFDKYAELGVPQPHTIYENNQAKELQIDITKLDDTKARSIEENGNALNKPEEMVKALGSYFKIPKNIKCDATYKVELN